MDERVAHYLRPTFWLFWTNVRLIHAPFLAAAVTADTFLFILVDTVYATRQKGEMFDTTSYLNF